MAAKKDIKDEAELDLDKEPEDDEVSYKVSKITVKWIWDRSIFFSKFPIYNIVESQVL